MYDLDTAGWILLLVCGLMTGLSKTGMPGLGIVSVPTMAAILPARASTGVLLPMLLFADIFAVTYYRRHAVWSHLVCLIPFALVGVVLGYLAMGRINDDQLGLLIGVIILGLLVINWIRTSRGTDESSVPTHWSFAAGMGIAAGFTTMIANAAGPIMILYLLAMRLSKKEFIGTGAWYFIIVNAIKVPFSADLGLINAQSLRLDLAAAPAIAAGALAGILLLPRIPERVFAIIVRILAIGAAANLIIRAWGHISV